MEHRWVLEDDGAIRYDRLDKANSPKRCFDAEEMVFKELWKLPPPAKTESASTVGIRRSYTWFSDLDVYRESTGQFGCPLAKTRCEVWSLRLDHPEGDPSRAAQGAMEETAFLSRSQILGILYLYPGMEKIYLAARHSIASGH
jgi:hypothetical protein